MKIKVKKFWEITYCHFKYNEDKFKMIAKAKNVGKAVECFYNELHSNWWKKASDYIIVEVKQLEVNVNE